MEIFFFFPTAAIKIAVIDVAAESRAEEKERQSSSPRWTSAPSAGGELESSGLAGKG